MLSSIKTQYKYNQAITTKNKQGSKFHLSVSPGQVDFSPDNKITKFCCPSDNLDRGSVARQILVSTLILSGMTILLMKSTKTTT